MRFKTVLTLLATLSILLLGLTQADYDQRLSELKTELEKDTTFPQGERDKVLKSYASYLETRNGALRELTELVGNRDKGKKEEQQKNIVAKIGSKLTDIAREISPIASNTLFPGFAGLYKKFYIDEITFIERLEKSNFVKRRDQINELRVKIIELQDNLESKWQENLNIDKGLDERQTAAANEVKFQIGKFIEEMAEKNKTFTELTAKVVDKTGVAGPITEVLGKLGDVIDLSAENVLRVQKSIEERLRVYQSLVDYEKNGVLILFTETYLGTQKYIKENGYDTAKSYYALADTENKNLQENGTSAQRNDAKDFFDKTLRQLSDTNLRDMEDAFKAFIAKHENKFFGPIGPDIKEQLLETRSWERYKSELEGLDLESKLRRWRDDNEERFLKLNLTDTTEVNRKRIKDFLELHFKKLNDAIRILQYFSDGKKISQVFDRKEIEQFLADRTR
jgi:hypothetical protein